jgi:hypothetical protein
VTTSDVLDVGALTTETSVTAVTSTLQTTAGKVYFLAGQAAGSADTAAAAAAAVTAGATWTLPASSATAFIVIVDNNSSAVYSWTDATVAGVQETELTLIGTVEALLVSADIGFGG